jgi:molybdate transport system ATP-binding protein
LIEKIYDLISFDQNNHYSIIIQMTNVNVEYDGKKILQNITWVVKQGERWSLTGPNGAGKSNAS